MNVNGKEDGVGCSEAAAKPTETGKQVDLPNDSDVKLDEAAQMLIGQHLKAAYSEIVCQPIPDQFLQLLDELERKERDR